MQTSGASSQTYPGSQLVFLAEELVSAAVVEPTAATAAKRARAERLILNILGEP